MLARAASYKLADRGWDNHGLDSTLYYDLIVIHWKRNESYDEYRLIE
jgi:hypothetical protein